jgi:hypothetical protein
MCLAKAERTPIAIAVCRDISADPMGLPLSFRGATERACVDIRPDGYISAVPS